MLLRPGPSSVDAPFGTAAEITHYDPDHGKPHRLARTEPITCYERDDGSSEAAQVIDGDDDPQESSAGVVHNVQEISVADDTREHALIIALVKLAGGCREKS